MNHPRSHRGHKTPQNYQIYRKGQKPKKLKKRQKKQPPTKTYTRRVMDDGSPPQSHRNLGLKDSVRGSVHSLKKSLKKVTSMFKRSSSKTSRQNHPLHHDYNLRTHPNRTDTLTYIRIRPELDIDYTESYRRPSHYYIKDSPHGKVYSCPPPKHNLTHVNMDYSLGGERFRRPLELLPCIPFVEACKLTPVSDMYTRIIPWDNHCEDFVYGAVQDACFRGFFDRRSLKSKIDFHADEDFWNPVKWLNPVLVVVLALLVLLGAISVAMGLIEAEMVVKNWNAFGTFLGLIIAIILVFVIVAVAGVNYAVKKRYHDLCKTCEMINTHKLAGSGVQIYPGPLGAYLSVEMAPARTLLQGKVFHDKHSYSTLNEVAAEQENLFVPIRRPEEVPPVFKAPGGFREVRGYMRRAQEDRDSIEMPKNEKRYRSKEMADLRPKVPILQSSDAGMDSEGYQEQPNSRERHPDPQNRHENDNYFITKKRSQIANRDVPPPPPEFKRTENFMMYDEEESERSVESRSSVVSNIPSRVSFPGISHRSSYRGQGGEGSVDGDPREAPEARKSQKRSQKQVRRYRTGRASERLSGRDNDDRRRYEAKGSPGEGYGGRGETEEGPNPGESQRYQNTKNSTLTFEKSSKMPESDLFDADAPFRVHNQSRKGQKSSRNSKRRYSRNSDFFEKENEMSIENSLAATSETHSVAKSNRPSKLTQVQKDFYQKLKSQKKQNQNDLEPLDSKGGEFVNAENSSAANSRNSNVFRSDRMSRQRHEFTAQGESAWLASQAREAQGSATSLADIHKTGSFGGGSRVSSKNSEKLKMSKLANMSKIASFRRKSSYPGVPLSARIQEQPEEYDCESQNDENVEISASQILAKVGSKKTSVTHPGSREHDSTTLRKFSELFDMGNCEIPEKADGGNKAILGSNEDGMGLMRADEGSVIEEESIRIEELGLRDRKGPKSGNLGVGRKRAFRPKNGGKGIRGGRRMSYVASRKPMNLLEPARRII